MRTTIFKKQACQCNHGKSIHYPETIEGKIHNLCHYPNCACKDYKPTKPA